METVGYFVADELGVYGIGTTETAAWVDCRRVLDLVDVDVLDDDADTTEQSGSWTKLNKFRAYPATVAAIAAVEKLGGNRGWVVQNGVAYADGEV